MSLIYTHEKHLDLPIYRRSKLAYNTLLKTCTNIPKPSTTDTDWLSQQFPTIGKLKKYKEEANIIFSLFSSLGINDPIEQEYIISTHKILSKMQKHFRQVRINLAKQS